MYPYRSEFSIIIESKSKVSLYFLNCVVISFHEKKKNNNNFQIQRLRNDKFCSIDITRYICARYNSSTFFFNATSQPRIDCKKRGKTWAAAIRKAGETNPRKTLGDSRQRNGTYRLRYIFKHDATRSNSVKHDRPQLSNSHARFEMIS